MTQVYTLKEAALAAGVDKKTITRNIATGKIQGTTRNPNGSYSIPAISLTNAGYTVTAPVTEAQAASPSNADLERALEISNAKNLTLELLLEANELLLEAKDQALEQAILRASESASTLEAMLSRLPSIETRSPLELTQGKPRKWWQKKT